MCFWLTPPPLNFFGIRFWKKILFFLFKVRTYLFGIYSIFLHIAMFILIFGKNLPTRGQKSAFLRENNTIFFRKWLQLVFLKTFSLFHEHKVFCWRNSMSDYPETLWGIKRQNNVGSTQNLSVLHVFSLSKWRGEIRLIFLGMGKSFII